MTEVIRSLRLKRIGLSQVSIGDNFDTGRIDSGATSALRQATEVELSTAKKVKVQLAAETELWLSALATLLSDLPVQPIVPMACLPALGSSISWTDRGISIVHPSRGLLPVRLKGACPELPAELAVQLIRDYEGMQGAQEAERLRRISMWDDITTITTPGSENMLPWLASHIQREGLTVSVQLRFLKQFFRP